MPEIKEFKTTCLGCGNITFRPYLDFDQLRERANKSKAGNVAKETAVLAGATSFCLPLGCCMATDSINKRIKPTASKEEQIKTYCEAFICKSCNSTALKTEVVTHNVD